ncbi:MAG TPA: FapA family protein [Phycisphaerales bacterium]|nr:FapA family protein [Phycisphaerales bacterium]
MSSEEAQPARIEVSADAVEAELVVAAGAPPLDRAAIIAMAADLKLELTPASHELIDDAVRTLAACNGAAARMVIARGTAPRHALPGKVQFEPGYDPEEIKRALESAAAGNTANRPTGSVDHYTRSVFNFVKVGAHVGTIIYPSAGAAGRDVFGNTLEPQGAASMDFSVDDTLKKCDDGSLIARRPGVLEWGPGGLHITDTITIPGSIDFSVGHIEFPGSVCIKGGVRDLFKVIAKGDVTIEGLIEAATIKAGGDAFIRGGMAAKEKGSLESERDCTAKYLNNVSVNVGRDLTVERELVNCRVTVGRNINGAACGIAGGAIAVAGSIVVNTLGSEMGVATDLRLGSIPSLDAVLKEALVLIPLLENRRAKHLEPLDQLRAVKGRHAPTTIERMAELQRQVDAVNDRIQPLEDRLARLRATLRARTVVDLTVNSRIHPKVLITAGNFTIDFTHELRGPVRILLDDNFTPCLCTLNGTPSGDLAKHAKVRRIDLTAGANSAARAA